MPTDHAHSCGAGLTKVGVYSAGSAGTDENPAVLTLDDVGMVCDCNSEGEALFRYHRDELVGRHVSLLLPQLTELQLIQSGRLNPYLRARCRFGCHFQAVTGDGEYFAIDLFLNLLGRAGHDRLSVIVRRTEEAGHDSGPDQGSD